MELHSTTMRWLRTRELTRPLRKVDSHTLRALARLLGGVRLSAARAQGRLDLAREAGADALTIARLEGDVELTTQGLAIGESEWARTASWHRAHGLDISHLEPPRPEPFEVRGEVEAAAEIE
jgi:hypothetical protein